MLRTDFLQLFPTFFIFRKYNKDTDDKEVTTFSLTKPGPGRISIKTTNIFLTLKFQLLHLGNQEMLQKFYETNMRFSKEFQISEKIKLKNLEVYIKHRVRDTKVHR